MNRFIAVLLVWILSLPAGVMAENEMEIIGLKHRTVEEVMPALLPLLEPDGVLTGMHGQLILRASPSNRAQIRQALDALDAPLRQLLVTVRQGLESGTAVKDAEIYGKAAGGPVGVFVPPSGSGGVRAEADTGKVRVGARLEDRNMNQFSRVSQVARVVDGGQAFIQAGIRLPMTQREVIWSPYGQTTRESMVYVDVDSGFYVSPHVIGDRVNLEINTVQQAFSAADPYTVVGQDFRTILTGRLDEWIELGGGEETSRIESSGLTGKSTLGENRANQVWLKVEVIK